MSNEPGPERVDVVVVGGGPAGLSAALVLGRCRRSVLLCDAGTPRNGSAERMWAFISREGMPPGQFRATVREELARYPHVRVRDVRVRDARRRDDASFDVTMADGAVARCRKLLIATGVHDVLPPIDGLAERFGHSVFQCPYCDAYELGDMPIGVLGRGRRAIEMTRAMTAWSRDLVLFTDGPPGLPASDRAAIARHGVRIESRRIARLEGDGVTLSHVALADGERIARRALFFDMPSRPQCELVERLGASMNRRGGVRCGAHGETTVTGVFAAGNILRDVQLSIVAAAEGAKAAFGVNRALTREDFVRRATGERTIEHEVPVS